MFIMLKQTEKDTEKFRFWVDQSPVHAHFYLNMLSVSGASEIQMEISLFKFINSINFCLQHTKAPHKMCWD